MFLESPDGFLTFVFGTRNSCFWRAQRFPDICFWCPKLMFLESPDGLLTSVIGAQNSCFWRAQKVSWHLFLVPKFLVFGEPRRCPDICFWCPTLIFLESPEGFLTFVFGAQNSWFWRAQKVPWQFMILQSPEGFLKFVFGAQNSCFLESPEGFLIFCFWFPKILVFGQPRRFPDILFWFPKRMFLESLEGFLPFVFGAQNSCFWRAQKVCWHLLLVPKTHDFGEPRRFPDKSWFNRAQKVSWHLFLVPKTHVFGAPRRFPLFLVPKTHVFGEPRRFPAICFWCPKLMFLESPEGFLTFVFGVQNSCFWRAQKVSWHLLLVPRTHFFGEPRRFPDICCWCPKLTFLESPEGFLTFVFGAQNSCFWRA